MNSLETEYPLRWELDSLLAHPERVEFQHHFDCFREELSKLAKLSQSLPAVDTTTTNTRAWVKFLQAYEAICVCGGDLGSFIACHAAAAAENQHFHQIEARLAALVPMQEKIAANIEFALKESSDEMFHAFLDSDPRLAEIRFYLSELRRNAQLRLPQEQESLANELAVDGIHAWGRLYDRLSGKLRVQVMERGELVEKSVGQIQFDSPQRSVRQNNFYAADKAWGTLADTCADAINHIAGARLTVYRRLAVRDHLEVPCRLNRMRRETLDAMWQAVSARKSMLLDYLDAKAKAFSLDKLTWCDVMAPYPTGPSSCSELDYAQACGHVIETFNRFSPAWGEFARLAICEQWIEAENRPGKRQGGFCTGFAAKKQSRIFMTFTNSVDSMSTLAHELGHAYHSYVLREETFFLQHYPMNLAETASTFAEAVVGENRLQQCETAADKLTILDTMLSDAVTFLMNIHARFIFEDQLHIERGEGELTAGRLSELMLSAQQEAYANGLDSTGWYPNFWISKLHFYITGLPFYNFPYTFGYLLSLGVFALGKEGRQDFPEQYRQLLVATGCQNTEDAVQSTLDYDLTTVDFWNKSLDIVEQRVECFLELV